jgi:hypothetical protein
MHAAIIVGLFLLGLGSIFGTFTPVQMPPPLYEEEPEIVNPLCTPHLTIIS